MGYYIDMRSLPTDYDRLSRWFPLRSERADAIGVSREMIWRWERTLKASTRPTVRARTAQSIEAIAAAARETERLVGGPTDAGRWMLVRQPSLRGASVADALRDGQAAKVTRLIAPTPDVRGVFSSEEMRAAASRLGPDRATARERPRAADEVAVLRRIGEDPLLIGPSADD